MINDLATSSKPLSGMWKFADDTTVSEIVPKSGATKIKDSGLCPSVVKRQQIQAALVKVQGTPNRLSNETERGRVIEANGNAFETIKSAKVQGVIIRIDLKWNDHVDNITVKANLFA